MADGETDGVDFDTVIAVDDGKVEVCSPMGWTRGPQSKSYLVKYVPSRKKTYPSIVVMAAVGLVLTGAMVLALKKRPPAPPRTY